MKHPGPILKVLHGFQRSKVPPSSWERVANKCQTVLWKWFGLSFVVAVLAILTTSPFAWAESTVFLRKFAMASWLLSIWALVIFYTVYAVYGAKRFKDDLLAVFLAEVDQDLSHMKVLSAYDVPTLESAKYFLQLRCTRIKNRMSLLLGGPEKATLSSLLGLGVLCYQFVYKDLGVKLFADYMEGEFSFAMVFIFVIAGITGAAIGAVVMNFQLHRYQYQLELLELALKDRA